MNMLNRKIIITALTSVIAFSPITAKAELYVAVG
jgi:hypothetical protein